MEKLKPCPFCGGLNLSTNFRYQCSGITNRGKLGYLVLCVDCGATVGHCSDSQGRAYTDFETESAAIDAWNTRAERTCRIEERKGEWYCSACGEIVGTCDCTSELYIDGNAIELWEYCPRCGARVVDK